MPGPKKKKTLGSGGKTTIDLVVPSGETCSVIRPGVQGLIKAGVLDSLDTLTGLVQIDYIDANDPKKLAAAVKALSTNKSSLTDGLELMDKVVAFVVREPVVHLDPKRPADAGRNWEPDELPEGEIYASQIDLDDKSFIFGFVVGGTRDLESFRSQQRELVGRLSSGEDMEMPSK